MLLTVVRVLLATVKQSHARMIVSDGKVYDKARQTNSLSYTPTQNSLWYFRSDNNFSELLQKRLSVQQAFIVLEQLQSQSDQTWSRIFTKYAYFIEQLIDRHSRRTLEESYNLFIQLTELHKKSGNKRSQNLTKIYNRLLSELSIEDEQKVQSNLPLKQLINVILHVSYYNIKKAKHLMLKYRDSFSKITFAQEAVSLLLLMKQTNIYPLVLIEMCMDVTYDQANQLTINQVNALLECLADSSKVINSEYLLKILDTIPESTRGLIILHITSAVSTIEKNMRLDSLYMFDLDRFYDRAFARLDQIDLGTWSAGLLIKLVNCLRRTGYYHEGLLKKLTQLHLNSQIKQLASLTQAETGRSKHLVLSNLLALLHLTAVFNLPSKSQLYRRYVQYCKTVLEMIMKSSNPVPIQNKHIARTVWSLCVLLPQSVIRSHIQFLIKQIKVITQDKQNHKQNQEFFSGYLYILDSCREYFRSIDGQLCNLIDETLSVSLDIIKENKGQQRTQDNFRTYVSATQKSVVNVLLQMGIPCIEEHRVHNLYCDICVPDLGKYCGIFMSNNLINQELRQVKNVIIEMHGYQHFLRNAQIVKGGTVFKKKLLQLQNYNYYYIPIDQWEMASNKQVYLKQFLTNIYMDVIQKRHI